MAALKQPSRTRPAASLTPEASDAIRAAQEALQAEAGKAELVSDPIAGTLRALSLMLGGLHKLFIDGTAALGRQIEDSQRQPVGDADLRWAIGAAATGEKRAMEPARAANWRMIAIAVAGGLAFGALCAGGGWAWRGQRLENGLPGLTCTDQQDGSRICYKFVRPPAAVIRAPGAPG